MIHEHRTYQVKDYSAPYELAQAIKMYSSWTGCTGFRYRGLLFLNDSTGADGLQEYAVVRESDMVAVESYTMSWMSVERFKGLVEDLVQRLGELRGHKVEVTVQEPAKHGRCYLCA